MVTANSFFHLKCVGTEDTQACVSCHSGGLNSSDSSECGLQLGDNAYPGISELKDVTNQRGSSFFTFKCSFSLIQNR